MGGVVIWHHPNCSKSRETLALIRALGIEPSIVRYLETPPSVAEIAAAARMMRKSVRELIRTTEASYRALGLDNPQLTDDALATPLNANPALIERPIVFARGKAAIGRPPEAILGLL